LRVPLVVKYPGDEDGGSRRPGPVSLADVAPTIACFSSGRRSEARLPRQPGLRRFGHRQGVALSEDGYHQRYVSEGFGIMAEEAKRLGAAIVHYSTDHVFDPTKAGSNTEEDEPSPLNVYGE